MLKKKLMLVLVILALSHALMAQEEGNVDEESKTDFSLSIGFTFNWDGSSTIVSNTATDQDIFEWGFNINFMWFKGYNFGYYLNFHMLFNQTITTVRSYPYYTSKTTTTASDYFYFDMMPVGICYQKALTDHLSFFAGIGPMFILTLSNPNPTTKEYLHGQMGVGIGATMEARLKTGKHSAFTIGAFVRANFFEKVDRKVNAYPYIGFSWT
jgi:hypothetical protein